MSRRVAWSVAVVLLTGCASTPSLYSWGHYEELIYVSHAKPGTVSPAMQIEKLEQDYQKARASNRRMHPGFHAHLGYLYLQIGKLDEALREFATEKAEFPESAVLVDRLVGNLRRP